MPKHSTDASRDALKRQHSHRVPSAEAQAILRDLRQRFLDLAIAIDDLLPPSRERSLALTHLDDARQWACNAATLGGDIREDLTVNIPA